MKVRDALQSEIGLIRDQRVNAYSEHAEKIPNGHWRALKAAISSEGDNGPGVDLIVAELEGRIIGSVALFPAKTDAYDGLVEELNYPEIRMLAVDPSARGKGAASALIKECIARAKAKGYDAVGLHTADFMKDAIQLYSRLGFERLPQYDFEPAGDGIIVKAFRLSI